MKNLWVKARKPLKVAFTVLWYVLAGTTANIICLVAISYITHAPDAGWLNISNSESTILNRGIFLTMVVGNVYGMVKMVKRIHGE